MNQKRFIHPDTRKKMVETQIKTWRKKLLKEKFDTLSWARKRKRIILEQENKCIKCGLSEWLNKSIPLEIDHIDGNNKNNKRNNLEGLCPNCHSLTNTWRGRGKTITRCDDKTIYETYLKCESIRQTLLTLGMAAKGNNYRRVKNILELYIK